MIVVRQFRDSIGKTVVRHSYASEIGALFIVLAFDNLEVHMKYLTLPIWWLAIFVDGSKPNLDKQEF